MDFSIKQLALAIACSTMLVACGGGSGDSGSAGGNPPVSQASDLEKAKALVNSAHHMVMDANAVSTAYKNVGNTWTFEGAGGLNIGLSVLSGLSSSTIELAAGTYTKSRLDQLLTDEQHQVQSSTDAELKISATGQVELKGVFSVKEIVSYQSDTSGIFKPVYGSPIHVSFENIKLQLPSLDTVSNSITAQLFAQGMIRVLPTANAVASTNLASLNLAGTQAHSVTLSFSDRKSLQQRLDDESDLDVSVTEASVHLDRVQVMTQSPISTFTLNKLDLTAKSALVDVLDENKQRIDRRRMLMPTMFAVQGSFETAQVPATKGSLDLKVSLDNSDLNKVYYSQEQFIMWGSRPDQGYTISSDEEDNTRFAQLSLALRLQGELTTDRKVPFDVNVTAKRTQFEQPSYGQAILKLNGETLTLKDKTTKLANGSEQVVVTVTHPNGAFVDVTQIDGAFISAPIKVGNTTQGNISQIAGGAYVARFTDNVVIGL